METARTLTSPSAAPASAVGPTLRAGRRAWRNERSPRSQVSRKAAVKEPGEKHEGGDKGPAEGKGGEPDVGAHARADTKRNDPGNGEANGSSHRLDGTFGSTGFFQLTSPTAYWLP